MRIRPLDLQDGPELAAMLRSQSAEYMRYFTPFAFDEATVASLLATRRLDVYMGIYWREELIGFFMLRGWDDGYDVPAYGVTIDQRFRGAGLGRLSLDASKSICKLRQAGRLMLKVHPENVAAKHLYEAFGFVQTGVDARNDNLVYHLEL